MTQGGRSLFYTVTSVKQPISQLFKIHAAHRAVLDDAEAADADSMRAVDARNAAETGSELAVSAIEAKARALESLDHLLPVTYETEDLELELNELLGHPPGTPCRLAPVDGLEPRVGPLSEYVDAARVENPEVRTAACRLSKAEHGTDASLADYIPEVGDFNRRGEAVAERRAQTRQARLQLEHLERKVQGDVEKAYRGVLRARSLVDTAREAHAVREEAARLSRDQERAAIVLPVAALEAEASLLSAWADLLQAQLNLRLAVSVLEKAIGMLR